MRSVTAPKFRRLKCEECGRIIPWSWYASTPKQATMSVDAAGKVTARCVSHSEPETRVE